MSNETHLMWAVRQKLTEKIYECVEAGADLNKTVIYDSWFNTSGTVFSTLALFENSTLAFCEKRKLYPKDLILGLLDYFLDHGANPNLKCGVNDDDDYYTPIMSFIYDQTSGASLEAIEKLYERGADLNETDVYGNTALSIAAASRFENKTTINIVKFLLQNGADPNKPNNSGLTPYEKAITKGNYRIAPMIRDASQKLIEDRFKNIEQKLAEVEQKNANLEKLLAEQQKQINLNNWKIQKENLKRLRATLSKKYRSI